jgi:glycosyltransferase involved in cell wall biosynthesis
VRKREGNKLTAMMQTRNESGAYLPQVLEQLSAFVDHIVIVDDASTDDTVAVCRSFPKVVRLVQLPQSLFHEEWKLRALLWKAAVSTSPDWLLSVDADELYEQKAIDAMPGLINQDRFDWVGFRFYDFWNDTHYRDDELWSIHHRHTVTLVRYLPGYPYPYPQLDHHAPRFSPTCGALPGLLTDLRVKHMGWAGDWEHKLRKYHRYKAMDPEGKWGSAAQYESILDLNPSLLPWREEI